MRIIDTPLKIKNMELKNRLVMPPMATAKAGKDGKISNDVCTYYDEKTKRGWIGLVICEHSFVMQEGKAGAGQVSISKDEDLEGLRRLVDTIHANGTCVFAQIAHAGQRAKKDITGMEPAGPDTMDNQHIQEVIESFADAAKRAREAGFDGVEIHSAHGYLLNQFYSPLANHRTDEYGTDKLKIHKEVIKAVRKAVGNDFPVALRLGACDYAEGPLANHRTDEYGTDKLKIHKEVIKAVRKAVGNDFPVALRLGACDYAEGGNTILEAVAAAKELEALGIDLLDISGGMNGYIRPGHTEQGYFQDVSEAVKQEVKIPVLLTGGITDVNAAEDLLARRKADLIGAGRAILKDTSWSEKAMDHR